MNSGVSETPLQPFSCAPFIREIGRGKEGARGLSREQASQLFQAILQGRVSDLELGAVLIAFRVKGETAAELLGFMDALVDGFAPSPKARTLIDRLNEQSRAAGKPVVVIPSYNGARRKPNFTPLLAGLLSQQGYPVLCHGLGTNATGRVSTKEVFDQMNWPTQNPPQFCAIGEIFPAMPGLLAMQQKLGVRNFSHTLVKLLVPAGLQNSFLMTSYTHPLYLRLQSEVLGQFGQTALVIRGHEGEAVAAPYRAPQMDAVKAGLHWVVSQAEDQFAEQPDPKPDISAQATAKLTLKWLKKPELMPHGFSKQLQAIESVIHHEI